MNLEEKDSNRDHTILKSNISSGSNSLSSQNQITLKSFYDSDNENLGSVSLHKEKNMLNLRNLQEILDNTSDDKVKQSNTLLNNMPKVRKFIDDRTNFSLYLFNENNK